MAGDARGGNTAWFVLLGIGQSSAFLGATILIGQEAPAARRGAGRLGANETDSKPVRLMLRLKK